MNIKMKRIIIEGYSDNPIMVSPSDIEDGFSYWSGEECIYEYDEERDEMNLLTDKYTSESDSTKYYKRIDDIYEEDLNIKECDGEFYVDVTEEVREWGFGDTLCTIQYGFNSEDILVSSHNIDIDIEMYEVDVEKVDYIPQDYPHQHYVAIYEGTNENGERIRIEETFPFGEDSYPECKIFKL